MADDGIVSEVLRRARRDNDRPGGQDLAYKKCRVPGCNKQALGLDGMCRPCSRERERTGRWETPPLPES